MRRFTEETFRTFDGVDLFYRHWPAPGARSAGAIVLFHRGAVLATTVPYSFW